MILMDAYLTGFVTGILAGVLGTLTVMRVRVWWRFHPRNEFDSSVERLRRL